MKTIFNRSVLAVLLAASLVACNKHSLDNGKPQLSDPPLLAHAARYDADDETGIVKTVILSESGSYTVIATRTPLDEKGTLLPPVVSGKYSIGGNNSYSLHGFGYMRVVDGTKATASSGVSLIISPTEFTTREYIIDVQKTTVTVSDVLYRFWTVDRTRLRVDGETPIAADFRGCDLNEIATFLDNNGIHHNLSVPVGSEVNGLDISALGSIVVHFGNGEAATATWIQTAQDCFRIRWEGTEYGFLYSIDAATVSYLDASCILTMDATVQTDKGAMPVSVVWVMMPETV